MNSKLSFCIGVAATLAWQSQGDAVRETIASSYPELGWLAPQAAPDSPSPMSTDLVAVRQSVDLLAAQFTAGQEQMTRDITKLHTAEQGILEDILDKISAASPRPAAAPARKPAPLTPAPLTPPPAVR